MSLITAPVLRETLDYDPKTGIFTWAKPTSRKIKQGAIAGSVRSQGYMRIKIGSKEYLQHRLAWLYVYGQWPENEIDHINGNRKDNRIENLRDVPKALNLQNRIAANRSNQSTGVLGVTFRPQEKFYEAKISVGGRTNYLGIFKQLEDAQAAYLKAKAALHPGMIE